MISGTALDTFLASEAQIFVIQRRRQKKNSISSTVKGAARPKCDGDMKLKSTFCLSLFRLSSRAPVLFYPIL
jgi:hypothetical protein